MSFQPIERGARKALDRLELVRAAGPGALGEKTGVETLDRIIGKSLEPGRLAIVGARPGEGKTALLLQIADHVASRGGTVAIWSGEMSAEAVTTRLAAHRGRLSLQPLREGNALRRDEAPDWQVARDALDAVGRLNIHVDDQPGTTVDALAHQAAEMAREAGLEVLIIDYIGLLSVDGKLAASPRYAQVAYITRKLKELALQAGIVVLAAAQLNRESVRGGREPGLTDLRDSGSLEQDADVVALIHRNLGAVSSGTMAALRRQGVDLGTADAARTALIYTAKCRDGATGMALCKWIPEQARFADLDDPVWAPYTAPDRYTDSETLARSKIRDLLRY